MILNMLMPTGLFRPGPSLAAPRLACTLALIVGLAAPLPAAAQDTGITGLSRMLGFGSGAGGSAPVAATDAGASPWDRGHASRARLLDGGGAGQAARMAGIEIALEEGYKTYWRSPGDSGLPPEFDWSGSVNVAAVEVLFPAPERFEDASGVFFGYGGDVVLPLIVTPLDREAPIALSLAMNYGVCKDICIPASANLAMTIGAVSRPTPPALAAALARVPAAQAPGAPGAPSVLSAASDGGDAILVHVRAAADAALFVEGPPDWYFDVEPAMQPQGEESGTFRITIAERPATGGDEPLTLALTLVSNGQAIETRMPVEPAP